ncbi:MAG TPA: histidine kinase [Terracidiphilus sp.]|jgi:signal transduction histidine kinase|nr:histidine kinase [Terracidiphilus sp.]
MSSIADVGQIVGAKGTDRARFARLLAKRWLLGAVLVVVGSSTLGLVFALPMLNMGMGWKQPLAQWWAWGIVAPFILLADRHLPFSGREFGRRAAAHGVASLVFTAVYIHVFFALRVAIGDTSLPGGPHWSLLKPAAMLKHGTDWFMWSCLIYWMLVGTLQAYRYYERYMSSELQLERMAKSYSQARLNALRMQLDPHFLFNALNTISSHVERDPKLTRLMIEHLGDLLRMSLESKDRQEVPLAEELAFLDHYLAIQRIRFGRRLKIDLLIAPEVRYASVPSLFLQPLVENAIRHGISNRASGGTVTVSAQPVNEKLLIRVFDDGAGLPPGWTLETSNGLGLSVTRERIAGLYPDGEGIFTIRSREGGGTIVEIVLPLRVIGEEANDGAA